VKQKFPIENYRKSYRWKSIVFSLFFFFVAASPFCTAQETQNIIHFQDIYIQWIEMEHQLNIENIETLYNSIQLYLDSDSYRIYRFMPFLTDFGFGHTDPNEIYEITAVIGLLPLLLSAVIEDDQEKIKYISNNISSNLVKALIWDSRAEQLTTGAYIRLFLVLIFIIMLAAFIIIFLNKELNRSLRREEEGSVYSRAVLIAQEEERSRLSRELHDTIAQDLRYLSLEVNKIGKIKEHTEREKLCEDTASLQSDLIRKVRDICNYLVPPDFRFQGLPNALQSFCLDFSKRTRINCRIDITGEIDQGFLNEEKQLQIFRIVQEALTNVEKHAQAAEAIVMLRCDENKTLSVGISDDGRGFNMPDKKSTSHKSASHKNASHLGIRGMNERAALLGGNLEIKSEIGEGTLVKLQIPHPPQNKKSGGSQ